MVHHQVNPPADGWSLTLPPHLWAQLAQHLFTDGGEHGAVILAGLADGPRGPRLLGRELLIARDGRDYVPGTYGYRALSPEFVRDAAVRAADEKLAYLAVHNHFGTTSVGFSRVDLASHERGYPALQQITGQIVGAVVLTPQAAAGDLWLPSGDRVDLAEVVIPGNNVVRLRPHLAPVVTSDPGHDRQARLFGGQGQQTLRRLRVAVVGLGGVGSMIVEFLARLGVGHLVLIEDDRTEKSNLARLVGAEPSDVGKLKTELAERNARRANPGITIDVIPQRVEHPEARRALAGCDWIFLAADTDSARHWVNEAVHRHLIPATQAGVKIPVSANGTIGQIHAVTRLLVPGKTCLWCDGLISSTNLAIDMHNAEERRLARYIDEVPAPSVIALNSLAVAEAVNHFMLAVTALHEDSTDTATSLHRPRSRERDLVVSRQDPTCPACGLTGPLGRGDN
ncbi:ThiF family adenylyltransferase [Lentzea kentuckyensis]|uniref:ThiF family adenylyltransferase n=1 Tax=Lentzea kentuckyensis TaxID=360086 RepID=UPI000A381977|nr:ThiF family adenylyltransferase [Lentzea kentuckyensis]